MADTIYFEVGSSCSCPNVGMGAGKRVPIYSISWLMLDHVLSYPHDRLDRRSPLGLFMVVTLNKPRGLLFMFLLPPIW